MRQKTTGERFRKVKEAEQEANDPSWSVPPAPRLIAIRRGGESRVETEEEYLSIGRLAARLDWSPKTVRNKMSGGIFREGEHFVRREGIGPRFLWSRVVEWLVNGNGGAEDSVPMARSGGRKVAMRGPK